MQMTPYLYFRGACEDALKFYQSCGLGAIRLLRRYEGTPMAERDVGAWRDKVLHSLFEGPGVRLFAGDGPELEADEGLSIADRKRRSRSRRRVVRRPFRGGRVTVPFKRQFWGDHYGNFTDRFGVQWAINISSSK